MSELVGSFANDENSGGAESFKLLKSPQDDILLKYVNGLDVNVDITIDATYREDKSGYNDSEELRGSNADVAALTVNNDSTDSDLITEEWEAIKVTTTPASDPSSGSFDLRVIRG